MILLDVGVRKETSIEGAIADALESLNLPPLLIHQNSFESRLPARGLTAQVQDALYGWLVWAVRSAALVSALTVLLVAKV